MGRHWRLAFALLSAVLYPALSDSHPPDPACANVGCITGSTGPCCPGWDLWSALGEGTVSEGGEPEWVKRIKVLEEKVEAIENPNTDGTIFFDESGGPYTMRDGVRFCSTDWNYTNGEWEECEGGGYE